MLSQAPHSAPSSSSTPSKGPRRCKLCNYIEESSDSPHQDSMSMASPSLDQSPQRSCSRCGLVTSSVSDGPEQRLLMLEEAAKAYEFTINAEMMTRFPPEISKIVVHYLLWYRGPNDFHVGDVVDAQDLRGKWYPATVLCVEKERVLVHYHGWSDKWNTWYARTSSALAPSGSKTGHGVGGDGMGVTVTSSSSSSRANSPSSFSSSAEYMHSASEYHLSVPNSYSSSSSSSASLAGPHDRHSALSPSRHDHHHHHHSTSLSIDRPSISASSSHASLSSLRESRWDDIGMPNVSADDVAFE